MDFLDLDTILSFLPMAIAVLSIFVSLVLVISLHEWAHAWMANKLGDPTARMLGRMTINPLKHIDPIGTVLMPIGLLIFSLMFMGMPFTFGYAKPVPFNPRYLKNPKRDTAFVGIAGPAINIIMAVGGAIVLLVFALLTPQLIFAFSEQTPGLVTGLAPLGIALGYFCYFNLLICFFNLLPIPPLDGSRVVQKFLTGNARHWYTQLERYGMFIVMGLLFIPPMLFGINLLGTYFSVTLWPVFEFLTRIPVGILFNSVTF